MYCKFPSFRCPVPEQVETAMTEMRARRTMHAELPDARELRWCATTGIRVRRMPVLREPGAYTRTETVFRATTEMHAPPVISAPTGPVPVPRWPVTMENSVRPIPVTPQRAVCSPMRTGRAVTTEIVARPMMRAPEEVAEEHPSTVEMETVVRKTCATP